MLKKIIILAMVFCMLSLSCLAAEMPTRWKFISNNGLQEFYLDKESLVKNGEKISCWMITNPLNNEKSLTSWLSMVRPQVVNHKLPIKAEEVKMLNYNLFFDTKTRSVRVNQSYFMRSIDDPMPAVVDLSHIKWAGVRPGSVNEKVFFAAQEILKEKEKK